MPTENNFENMIVQAMPPLQQIQGQICPVAVPTGIVTLDMTDINKFSIFSTSSVTHRNRQERNRNHSLNVLLPGNANGTGRLNLNQDDIILLAGWCEEEKAVIRVYYKFTNQL